MCLPLETLTFIIRTGIPILVELIDLVNSVIISNDLRWLTFLLASQTVVFTVLLFWIFSSDASLCSAVVSLQWEILIMLLSQFPLTFHHINNGMPRFIALLMTILVIIGTVYVIIRELLHGNKCSVLPLLLVNFVSAFRLKLIYISLIESIRSSLTHLHGFQLLLLLP